MYQPDTILRLKELRSTPEVPFPYDRVRVINQSPIDHGTTGSAWTGANGQGVIITPLTDFASTIDEPYGKLQRLYEVEELPAKLVAPTPVLTVIEPNELGASPEDVFAAEADVDGEDGRVGKPVEPVVSPLDGEVVGVVEPVSNSPIGPLEVEDVPRSEPEINPDASPLDG